MAQVNVPSPQKITAAAGDNSQLREILQSLVQSQAYQQQATTTGTSASVPPQVQAIVTYLAGNYIVEITNPGAISPTSALQAAQNQQIATQSSNLQPVVSIFHQIRAATSPSFNISSNVTTFGGDTGSPQTYWTIGNLPAGQYYFQVRSTYDGVNWNIWKNANGGQTVNPSAPGVTIETANNSVWAMLTLPGKQLVGFGAGLVPNLGSFGVPQGLYSSALLAIAGLNGYAPQSSNLAHGLVENELDINGTPGPGTVYPPDFPTILNQQYLDGSGNTWSGSANIFGMAYDPLGSNFTVHTGGDGTWIVFTLPGGSQIAFGNGPTLDGASITYPPDLPWIDTSRMVSMITPNQGTNPTTQAHGINESYLDSGSVVHCNFRDGGASVWGASATFFIVAWTPGLNTFSGAGGNWLVLKPNEGTNIAIGGGMIGPTATPGVNRFDLPPGFNTANLLTCATPQNFIDTGHPMAGVAECSAASSICSLLYTDTQGNGWTGDVNWLAIAWQ